MKNILIVSFIFIFLGSCSFHSRQTKVESGKNEKEKESIESKQEKLAQKEDPEKITPILVKKEISEVEKVLNKKINPNTFEADMKIIEESKLYDDLTCQSLRYSYNLVRQYSLNSWDMTYRKALESAKEGSESARRIEKLNQKIN